MAVRITSLARSKSRTWSAFSGESAASWTKARPSWVSPSANSARTKSSSTFRYWWKSSARAFWSMSVRTRISENSKKPAMGGGSTYSVPRSPSQSTSSARPASTSSVVRASASPTFQIAAACFAVKGRMGSSDTSAASRSPKRIFRIRNRLSAGGAPCGKRFSRSVRRS